MKHIRLNDFDILHHPGSTKKAVVILHGYGASFQDLAPLYSYLDPQGQFNWYFVDGPLSVDLGMGMIGKAWFPIDMMKLQQGLLNGSFESMFADHEPEMLPEISERIEGLLKEIATENDEVYLGGFSQGSMVSLSVALHATDVVDKLILLSSTLFNEQRIDSELSKISQLKTFQSHGAADPVLPMKMAKRLSEKFEDRLESYEFHRFSGGHEIPLDIIEKLKVFLNS